MILLRLAAFIAALTTITLNAKHGVEATAVFELAVLYALLNAALDVAKCTLIGATVALWRRRSILLALLSLLLFALLFLNSVWNAVSQVAITREAGKARAVADHATRTRAEADHRRLTRDLASMTANPTYEATSACALPKSPAARTFCVTVANTKAELARLNALLTIGTAADPEPQVTLLVALSGWQATNIRFNLAIIPVVLAELLGAFGFVIAASAKEAADAKAPRASLRAQLMARLPTYGRRRKASPAARSDALDARLKGASTNAAAAAPTIQWSLPR